MEMAGIIFLISTLCLVDKSIETGYFAGIARKSVAPVSSANDKIYSKLTETFSNPVKFLKS